MKVAIVLISLAIATSAHAGRRIESCSVGDVVPGVGWVHKDVPCSSLERPIPCTREWTDEKGSWHSQVIECPAGTKQKTFEQVEREEEAVKEKRCGKDYGVLRIGITLKRFEQCNEALAYETTTVSKAGKVDVYRSTFYWVQVQGGKVVGYTRRTF